MKMQIDSTIDGEDVVHFWENALDSMANLAHAYSKGYVTKGELREQSLYILASFKGSVLTHAAFTMD